jgi:hypothetical protein
MTSDQYSPYGAGKIAGATEERERIIKMLEEYYWVGDKSDYGLSRLIALIKGENK